MSWTYIASKISTYWPIVGDTNELSLLAEHLTTNYAIIINM